MYIVKEIKKMTKEITDRKQDLLFKGQVLKWMREFFELKGIPEIRYNQFSFAGSCENAPTTYWLDVKDEFGTEKGQNRSSYER